MFTGIIHNQGTVTKKQKSGGQVRFRFKLKKKQKIRLGQSIAINGVCLTVAKVVMHGSAPLGCSFEADVMKATLDATTLGSLKLKDRVNLEKALCYGDELGGHFVTGHVDVKGKITQIKKNKKNHALTIKTPESIRPFLAPKGSITVDGISLTVQSVKENQFTVGIIPHTRRVTNLKDKREGDEINLEVDLVARYLKAMDGVIKAPKPAKLSLKKLRRLGF